MTASAHHQAHVTESVMRKGEGSGRRWARWIAAGLLLAGLAVAAAVSGSTSELRVCSLSAEAEESCRPMAISDPHVVATFALVALLILPDVSKVKIGGLFELERMISETSRKIDATDAKLESVLQQVAATALANSHSETTASNSQKVSVNLITTSPAQLDEALMAQKAREGLGVD